MTIWKPRVDTAGRWVVLIASQDAESVSVWEKSFVRKGCCVICEVSPHQTLQSTRLISPALIILDLDLPHPELLDLCRQLRSASRGTILLMTAITDEQKIYQYYLAGVDEHLAVPVNPMALLIKSIAWLVKQDWLDVQQASSSLDRP